MSRLADLLLKPERTQMENVELKKLLGAVEGVVWDLGGLSPVTSLANIRADLGTVTAGEFRVGNGKAPGDSFTGVRIRYPAMTYGGSTYHLVGVSSDTLQVGLSATDGKLYGGAGAVILDSSGITINSTNELLRLQDGASNDVATIFVDASDNLQLRMDGTGAFTFDSGNVICNNPADNDSRFELRENDVLKGLFWWDASESNLVLESDEASARIVFNTNAGEWHFYNESAAAYVLKVIPGGSLFLKESAAAAADEASYGQLWVKNVSPNELWFTDDAGTDVQITTAGAGAYVPLQPSANVVINESGGDFDLRIEGDTYTHLFYIDAGLDAVQIGTTAAGYTADFTSSKIWFNKQAVDQDFQVGGDTATHALYVDAGLDAVQIGTISAGNIADFRASAIVFNEDGDATLDLRVESDNSAKAIFLDSSADLLTFEGVDVVINETGADKDTRIEGDTATQLLVCDAGDDKVRMGTTTAGAIADFAASLIELKQATTVSGVAKMDSTFLIKEQSTAGTDVAAYGQLWMKSETPNVLMFTDDAGTDWTVDVTVVGTTGYFGGGNTGSISNVIDYIDITTTSGDASDTGDLTVARYYVGGCAGVAYGFFGGGYTGAAYSNVIDYIDVTSDTGNATDRGDLQSARSGVAGCQGSAYGFLGGGTTGSVVDTIDYIDITSTTGNGADKGNLTVARKQPAACEGGTYGFFGGGRAAASSNVIGYITLATTSGDATDKGDLTVARWGSGGISGSSYGFFGGGDTDVSGGSYSNIIDYIDVTTTSGDATDKGDLTAARVGVGGTDGDTYGYFGGGDTGSVSNIIDYIDITTTSGDATDRGDLTVAREANAGIV